MAVTEGERRPEAVPRESADILQGRLERLRELVPEAFSEGRFDVAKLQEALGDAVEPGPERYSFTWAGKRDAIQMLQAASRATLAPCHDESVSYDTTQNIFIEGENLEVLKLLYKSYFGRVKMIYIDPPYNTGNDFIYPDNFSDPLDTYLRLTGQKDAEGNLLTSNPETSGRYHSAWLSMMYPRLFLARQLLRDDGVIFVSIDDHEVHNLRMLMNEVFGEENFVATAIWQRKYSPQNDEKFISPLHEYVAVYARNIGASSINLLPRSDEAIARYKNPDNDPRGPWKGGDLTSKTKAAGHSYEIVSPTGKTFKPAAGRQWAPSFGTYERLREEDRIWFGPRGDAVPSVKQFLSEVQQGAVPTTLWLRAEVGDNQEAVRHVNDLNLSFDSPKPVRLVRRMLQILTSPAADDLILDFFAGSCPTAEAVLELNREDGGNRRFIMVQLPEPTENPDFPTIAEIGKERIRRVIKKMQEEAQGKLDLGEREEPEDLGFKVFKLRESSFRQFEAGAPEETPEELMPRLEALADPLKEGWQPEDVIYEIAIREGYGLNIRIEPVTAGPPDTWKVTDPDKEQTFLVCLAAKLTLDETRPLSLSADDLFIARDSALDDQTAANLALQCRLKTV